MRTELRPGAIFHMLAGEELDYDGEKRARLRHDHVPEELGGDEVEIPTARCSTSAPKCGDTAEKPMLVLEKGIHLSECLNCQEMLWLG